MKSQVVFFFTNTPILLRNNSILTPKKSRKTCIIKIILYICRCNDKIINQNQINYVTKKSNRRQNCQGVKVGSVVCYYNSSIYNWKFFIIMEKSAKKTHQELLIEKLEAMKLRKSMEIDEINQLINKLKSN